MVQAKTHKLKSHRDRNYGKPSTRIWLTIRQYVQQLNQYPEDYTKINFITQEDTWTYFESPTQNQIAQIPQIENKGEK